MISCLLFTKEDDHLSWKSSLCGPQTQSALGGGRERINYDNDHDEDEDDDDDSYDFDDDNGDYDVFTSSEMP